MRAYICGPMTGKKHYNYDEFMEAKWEWEEQGWEIDIPFDTNSLVWMRHFKRPFDPRSDSCNYGNPLLKEMFVEDVATLLRADAVIALPGWEESLGASIEVSIAKAFGVPVFSALDPVRSPRGSVYPETEELRLPEEEHGADSIPVERVDGCSRGDVPVCACGRC